MRWSAVGAGVHQRDAGAGAYPTCGERVAEPVDPLFHLGEGARPPQTVVKHATSGYRSAERVRTWPIGHERSTGSPEGEAAARGLGEC
jgi:hypothetical protein